MINKHSKLTFGCCLFEQYHIDSNSSQTREKERKSEENARCTSSDNIARLCSAVGSSSGSRAIGSIPSLASFAFPLLIQEGQL